MNISQVRIANLLLAALLVFAGRPSLVFYIAVMHVSLEILNTQPAYRLHPYKIYNLIFWTYNLVLLERLRTYRMLFSAETEWWINVLEHVAFGIIICLKLYIYTSVFLWKQEAQRAKRFMVAAIMFNIIGLVNELFQNVLAGRNFLLLTNDSIKDLWMNLLGAGVFILTASARVLTMRRKANVYF